MIAIIPAKKNSTRLPDKNMKKFCGKPLIAHTIIAALKSKYIKKVLVSSDSINTLNIAKKYGAEIHFRPDFLTTNKVSSYDVCNYIINKEKKFNTKIFKSFIILQPTSPLRDYIEIDNAIRLFYKKKADLVVSVTECEPKEWQIKIDKYSKIKKEKNKIKNSQFYDKNFRMNGAIYIYKILNSKKNLKQNLLKYAYKMPKFKSIDIDDKFDFENAKLIFKNKNHFT
tara:strand:+ start:802 stop:1479 length:678 start_codon:yes stop_codon:yes gene_type:complete